MKRILAAFSFLAIISAGNSLPAATVCPTTTNTNTDCGFLITIAANGGLSGVAIVGANPYDGGDDVLIGVINNSTSTFSSSIHLSGTGNGGGLFDFDGDGICAYVNAPYCATAPTGYEGPVNRFANIVTTSVFNDTGDVVITGLAAGASTYFSLESSPASITSGGGIIITPVSGTPEPATGLLLGSGLVGLRFLAVRKRKLARNQKLSNG